MLVPVELERPPVVEILLVMLAELVGEATLPIVFTAVHKEEDGAGCAAGVAASPWKNVEVPYTPIGYKSRIGQLSSATN